METKQWTTIDRVADGWPSGQWDSEPDKVQWQDKATGMPCLAVRHRSSGHWCGYVGVSEDHPLYEKPYHEIDLHVHGGLTFSDKCNPGDTEATGICHAPSPGEPDHVWWFGFDCAHAWDYSPKQKAYANERGYPYTIHDQTYKTLRYVQAQCKKLAAQLVRKK